MKLLLREEFYRRSTIVILERSYSMMDLWVYGYIEVCCNVSMLLTVYSVMMLESGSCRSPFTLLLVLMS